MKAGIIMKKILVVFVVAAFFAAMVSGDSFAQISKVSKQLKSSQITGTGKMSGTGTAPAPTATTKSSSKTTAKKAAASSSTTLLPDDEFTNNNYMTVAQIKNLLKELKSPMANEYEGVNPAEVIKEVADEFKINPLVILATLQKEQGLVQTTKKITKARLDWAMGVGVYDSGYHDADFKGFKNQIRGSAKTFRKCYNAGASLIAGNKSTKLKINYGKSTTVPSNSATYSLFCYTPHDAGAKLFTSVYKKYKNTYETKVVSASAAAAPVETAASPKRITE